MNKICPYQSHTYIGYDEIKVENCPIEEYYTEETEVCCYDSDYENCPIYNLQSKIDKAIEYIKTEASYSTFRNMCEGMLNYEKVNELLNILKEDK